MPTVARDRAALSQSLSSARRPLHLVPTMGALHAGHAAVLRAARKEAATVVMSLFVNPLQFDDPTDLGRYPRAFDADLAVAGECGVDVVWAPDEDEMYPGGSPATTIHVAGVSERWEGEHRPGHFDGVATVVAKLFHQVGADAAWFGRKDAQQLAVVRRMVADLDFPLGVREHPTVRDADGLALSSRNALLEPGQRQDALALSAGLFRAARWAERGELDAGVLETACGDDLEYAALVDADTFEPMAELEGRAVLAAAKRVGNVRLIDNVFIDAPPGGNIRADLGVRVETQ